MVVNNILLECVAVLVREIHMYGRVVGVDLPAAFVYRHEYRLDT